MTLSFTCLANSHEQYLSSPVYIQAIYRWQPNICFYIVFPSPTPLMAAFVVLLTHNKKESALN